MNYANLPGIELFIYCVSWTSAIIYALYELYRACQQYYVLYDCDEIFENGWSVLNGRKVDRTDYEWNLWTRLIFNLLPWFCVHVVGAEIFRRHSINLTLIWYISVTTLFITFFSNYYAAFLVSLQVFCYYLLIHFKSKCIIWVFFFISTVYQNFIITHFLPDISEDKLNIIFVTVSWLHLRCISFSSFIISSKCSLNILYIFGYCFYLPCFALGPLILFEDFISNLQSMKLNFWQRFFKAIFNFLRYSFWYYFTEFWLHFIYIGVLPHQLKIFNLNAWAMCGLGFAMGIFFYLKYIVVYGVSGSIVQFEGYDSPPPPRCIACIHLYSHMWRYFDCGLHKFIKNCIYKPLSNRLKPYFSMLFISLFVSFVCFTFIFLWHGLHYYVLIWSSLNFLGLVFELVCKKLSNHRKYHYHRNKLLSAENQRRFHALLAAPLTIMSAISNFYFFGEGVEVGTAFVVFLYRSSISIKFLLLLFMYTLSQVSVEYTMRHKVKTHVS